MSIVPKRWAPNAWAPRDRSRLTSGIAIIIAFGQIDPFFGVTSTGTQIPEMLASYVRDGFHIHLQSLAYGLLVVLFMIFWPKKLNRKIHASLLSLIIALIAQMFLNLPVLS